MVISGGMTKNVNSILHHSLMELFCIVWQIEMTTRRRERRPGLTIVKHIFSRLISGDTRPLPALFPHILSDLLTNCCVQIQTVSLPATRRCQWVGGYPDCRTFATKGGFHVELVYFLGLCVLVIRSVRYRTWSFGLCFFSGCQWGSEMYLIKGRH